MDLHGLLQGQFYLLGIREEEGEAEVEDKQDMNKMKRGQWRNRGKGK
jgi:hypothetical protein